MCWRRKRKLLVKLDYDHKTVSIKGRAFIHDIARLINDEGQKENFPQHIAILIPSGTDGIYLKLNDGWQFTSETVEDFPFKTKKKYRKKVVMSTQIISAEWVKRGE